MKLETLVTSGWDDYALIDSGLGRKLERIGGYVIDRPEPQAMWQPRLSQTEWDKADAIFMGADNDDDSVHGRWQNFGIHDELWPVVYPSSNSEAVGQNKEENIKFYGRLTSFRHVGFFPEQIAHWQWLAEQTKPGMKILNLFAYSGVHSLVAASKGAEVTHVDASKKAITWARENQDLNDPNWKIRWIVEDAIKFVEREVKRGNTYDGILLDPPKFGRGPNGETWELFDDLPAHLYDCLQLLKPDAGSFILMTSYAVRASAMAFAQLLADMPNAKGLRVTTGELFVQEENRDGKEGRLLPTSMFTRAVR